MNNRQCPLCSSDLVHILNSVARKDLVKQYQRQFNIDVKSLIKEDLHLMECKNCQLQYYYPLVTGDEDFYNKLQKFEWYYSEKKDEYIEAAKLVNDSDKILDVGCGKGAFANIIKNKRNFTGIDLSKEAKKLAKSNGIDIEIATIEDYSKKFPESFDVVCSFQVLEHVSDPKSFIESKLAALKNGGKLIISVPNRGSFLKYVTNGILNMPPHHVSLWNKDTLSFIARKYNLDLVGMYELKLNEEHKKWYLKAMIQNSFIKMKLVDTGMVRLIIRKFSEIISRFLIRGFRDEMLPHGHTIIAIYKK